MPEKQPYNASALPGVALPVSQPTGDHVFTSHPRRWREFHYVYPVISRRSGGLSIGINLNIDKACNFDCIYCCVDRSVAPVRRDVDVSQIREELGRLLDLAVTGEIWNQDPFINVDKRLRRVNDIAFSGDGEPTAFAGFEEACRIAVRERDARGLARVKVVVITNATMLDRPRVQRALAFLDRHHGEVWAKLDAGTEDYYQQVDRTRIPLAKVLDQILACGRVRPIVIQSLFMKVKGEPPSKAEFEAFVDRLDQLQQQGCRVKLVQLYTTARRTAEAFVSALEDEVLDHMQARLRERLPALPVEVYYGPR